MPTAPAARPLTPRQAAALLELARTNKVSLPMARVFNLRGLVNWSTGGLRGVNGFSVRAWPVLTNEGEAEVARLKGISVHG